jgi:hypothetical protein
MSASGDDPADFFAKAVDLVTDACILGLDRIAPRELIPK